MTAQLHQSLLARIAGVFEPIASIQSEDELRQLMDGIGWDIDALAGVDVAGVAATAASLRTAIDDLLEIAAEGTGELSEYAEAVAPLTEGVVRLVLALKDWSPPIDVDPAAVAPLPSDLLLHLLDSHLRLAVPRTASLLRLFGILSPRQEPAVTRPNGAVLRRAMARPHIDLEGLARLQTDPLGLLTDRFLHDSMGVRLLAGAAADILGPLLAEVVDAMGGVGAYGIPNSGAGLGMTAEELAEARYMLLARFEFATAPDPNTTTDTGAALTFLLAGGLTEDTGNRGMGVVVAPSGELDVSVGPARLTLAGQPGAILVTGSGADFDTTGSRLELRLTFATTAAPAVRFGSATATRFEIARTAIALSGDLAGDTTDFGIGLDLTGILLSISGGDGDGFLAKVLPADGITAKVDLGADWTMRTGLKVRGRGGLEFEIPVHVSLLGVLTIDIVHLRLALADTGLALEIAVTAALKLGPIAASVERIGLGAVAVFSPDGGNLGPLDLRPAFVPPRGVALSINASVVTGGGFILNDPENGRYAGILQLKIGDVVVVTAIGLVTTNLPDGSRGFSLLIIITAEFPPIQLGFGFNLSGLGGLLGLNRTMNVQALRDGVRTGVLDSILFPVDPVARATKVISDIESVFPIAEGRFVIGLMARIGWGSPRLVTVDLGIIVELPLPLRIALLGRIDVILPNPDAAVVELHLDVIGILDLGRDELSIDATLHDSRVAVFDIYGDMALRLSWGATQVFIVSVGGLNPRFERPPALPDLRRLTIALAAGENPSVKLDAYFAVTSNTIQTGARISAHAELDAGFIGLFTADAYLGFDALITLVPFAFIVDIGGGIVIRRNGAPFIGAEVLLTLYGPQPMRAVGFAEVHFLGTHRLPFDVTVGEEADIEQLPAVDPTDELIAAIDRINSWSALPPRDAVGVALRELPPGKLLAHPMGELTFKQRIVPLDIPIERFGGAPIAGGERRFALGYRLGGTTEVTDAATVRDAWAPGDFFTLTDDEKLSRPSFEQLPSGCTGIGPATVSFGTARQSPDAVYETRVIDEDDVARPADAYQLPLLLRPMLASLDASHRVAGYAGPDMQTTVAPQRYRLAETAAPASQGTVYASWVEARQALAGRPGLQVVGAHEVAP